MTYKQALDYILQMPRGKNESSLQAMRQLLHELDNPQEKLKFVHVAGTNGKGSTNVMTANVLQQAGYKVGLNISPFVTEFRERIQINASYIPKEALIKLVVKAKPIIEKLFLQGKTIVQFELVTALALSYFANEKCDIVCLEVGIGGLLDSTNIIENKLVTAICSISFDHTEILGNTLQEIARQKGGIIKQNTPVVLYPKLKEVALKEVLCIAKEKSAPVCIPSLENLTIKEETIGHTTIQYHKEQYIIPFAGVHQVYNTMVAIEICHILQKLGFEISQEAIRKGIENTKFPARSEVIQTEPTVVLDGSHNLDGIEMLCNWVDKFAFEKKTVIFAMKDDKDSKASLLRLQKSFDHLYVSQFSLPFSKKAGTLVKEAQDIFPKTEVVLDIAAFYKEFVKQSREKELFVFCGSLYFISEIRTQLEENLI